MYVLVAVHCPSPGPVVLPMVRFGLPKPGGHGYLHNADSDPMHHQYRLSIPQWNPGPARRNLPRLLQRLVITSPTSRTNSSRSTGHFRASGLCLYPRTRGRGCTRGTWTLVTESGKGKGHSHVLAPSTSTILCASTDLLRRLHAHMLQHNVDCIGGDFNFSTVGDVFQDPEFFGSRPILSSQGLVLWRTRIASAQGFLIMPKRPYEWRVDSHDCYKFNNTDLALGPP